MTFVVKSARNVDALGIHRSNDLMPDIDFLSFTTRSFEQFTQALAGAVLGNGIMIFGDGPDGGREAAFTGEVPYPTPVERWDGFIVMQAKFRERPTGDHRDADWLAEQLRRESVAYTEGKRPLPDYYIFVTNVRLSGVASAKRRGGQAKLSEAFNQYLKPLGVKAMNVWHQEKIGTFLDLQPELFRTYRPWLSTREILSKVFESLDARVPDFSATMVRILQRDLRAQRATRLQQAGHVGDATTNLEAVFVDLPYVASDSAARVHKELVAGGQRSSKGPRGVLAGLLATIAVKADPQTLALTWPRKDEPIPNRQLLLGGPGQGKSTITQFLAQVLRYRLLRRVDPALLSPDTIATLEAIGQRLAQLELPLDGLVRYPIKVDLPEFADALADSSANGRAPLSLLEFVAQALAKAGSENRIDVTLMREWLRSHPFVVILDGLDEVPPSSNRSDVIRALNDFWDEVIPLQADIVMVVTTRPQGYNDDLGPAQFTQLEMSRLDVVQALAYAELVAQLRIVDPERRERVLTRLKTAALTTTTALLMVSPLQVAILFQLIDQRGIAPADRWTLFDEYLSVVMKREQEKQGPGGDIVRTQETMIRRLLRRVALLVHVEAEQGGSASAFLTLDRLEGIIADLLLEEGWEATDLKKTVEAIVTAATHRLVFLEQRTEGRVEFDVRSLQEFLAAGELMGGSDASVRDRLREIAGRAHWAHVYRIAASKVFSAADAMKYRDNIVAINRELDAEGPGSQATRRGALISLELLADGLAFDQPRYKKLFCSHAIELLRVAGDPRLATFISEQGEQFVRAILPEFLRSGDDIQRRAAWSTLFELAYKGCDWFDAIAIELWPTEDSHRLEVVTCGILPPVGSEAGDRVEQAIWQSSPSALAKALLRAKSSGKSQASERLIERFAFLELVVDERGSDRLEADVVLDAVTPVELQFCGLDEISEHIWEGIPETEGWRVLRLVRDFCRQPSAKSFAGFISEFGSREFRHELYSIDTPWPLHAMAAMMDAGVAPADLAAELASGGRGDFAEWKSAEDRVVRDGVREADLAAWHGGEVLTATIDLAGAPYPRTLGLGTAKSESSDWAARLVRLCLVADNGSGSQLLRRMGRFIAQNRRVIPGLSSDEVVALFTPYGGETVYVNPHLVLSIEFEALSSPKVLELLDSAGTQERVLLSHRAEKDALNILLSLYDLTGLAGLLELAIAAAIADDDGLDRLNAWYALLGEISRSNIPENLVPILTAVAGKDFAAIARQVSGQTQASLTMHAIAAIGRVNGATSSEIETMLVAQVQNVAVLAHLRFDALRQLRALLDRRRSTLNVIDRWHALELPDQLFNRLECGAIIGNS
ncbi:MAG: putative NTPase, family [Bradyrhizobium sp.]|nr:putative NTPase, family [Bradyrhizobium sp.]